MPEPSRIRGNASSPGGSWVRTGFGLGIGLLLAYGLAQALLGAEQVLLLALLSLFIAVSLEPAVAALVRLGARRGVAVAVVVAGMLGVVAVFVALAVPPVTTEIDALVKAVPVWIQQLHDHHSALGRLEDRYQVLEKVKQHFSGPDAGSALFSGVLGMGRRLVGAVAGLLAVSTLTIYLLTGMPVIKRFALRFVRAPRRETVGDLTDRIMTQVGRYMLANVATSVLAGLATFAWAWPFGIPYPALLGMFVAIMDLVPIIGSTVGGIVVSLVALAVSVPVAAATAVYYTVFRFAEDHLVNPLTMKYVVRIHPAATMLAVLAGGTLLGIVGALVAVPAATAVGLILEEVVFPERDAAEPGGVPRPQAAAVQTLSSPGPDQARRPAAARPPRTGS
ncbi:AI-2E family transporter [Catenulispora subtropica]|uniref:AI-2E family transporter n=1 Tax=Catenulispora subtropica TaxID=450798 RepID=A0ABP5DW28_9ACTN